MANSVTIAEKIAPISSRRRLRVNRRLRRELMVGFFAALSFFVLLAFIWVVTGDFSLTS
jgi:hypothetical protein